MQLLQYTALSGGSGQCNSCNTLPHCPGAVGSATPAMHCLTALGQWAVELRQCTAPLPGGSGQWNPCNALPHCPGGSGQCNSCNALPHCLGAVGSATPAIHCRAVWGQWAAQLLQCTAALPGGSGGGGGGGGAPAAVPRTVSLGVVPRGPHAGSAEGVLRLTSARARRISSHT